MSEKNDKTQGPVASQDTRKKPRVEIYVPTDRCACEWEGFMNRVFEVLMPYIKEIDFDTLNSRSPEAREKKIPDQCVVVEGEIFRTTYKLKNRLAELMGASRK